MLNLNLSSISGIYSFIIFVHDFNRKFSINGAEIRLTTWFGLEYSHNGYTVIARIPALFQEMVQGLCGDYNMIKQDDYRLRNGTVLEYTESQGSSD